MNRFPLSLTIILLVSLLSGSTERDAGCGPGVYCGDSPDDDGDPCTPQPDDPRTPDYDEGLDDAPCGDFDALAEPEAILEPLEVVPAVDLTGDTPTWYEDPRSVNCERVPSWCQSNQYTVDMAERGEP